MSTIAVFNSRNEVGKTTTALNLLAAIGRRGRRPFAIDLDPDAGLSRRLGMQPRCADESMCAFFVHGRPLADIAVITRSGVVLCPAHPELATLPAVLGKAVKAVTKLRVALRGADGQEEPVIVDCGEGLGVLSLNAIFAADLTLVPVSPAEAAVHGAREVERALNALEPVFKCRLPRRYVLTRQPADHGGAMARRMADLFRKEEICATRIPENPDHAGASGAGERPRHAPEGSGSGDYAALLDELIGAGFVR